MRRLGVVCIALVVVTGGAFAQGFDFGAFATVPIDPESGSTFEEYLVGAKIGAMFLYDYEFVPFLSPGGEIWFSFPPIPIREDVRRIDIGGRVFNGMRLPGSEIQPFGEYVFSWVSADGERMTTGRIGLGVRVIVQTIGLEFAAVLPGAGVVVPQFGSLPGDLVAVPSNLYFRVGASWHARRR